MTRRKPELKCFACGADGYVLYCEQPDRVFGAPGTWSVRRCTDADCGLVWLDPQPTPEDLGLAYLDYYTHGGSEKSISHRFGSLVYGAATDALLAIVGITQERSKLRRMLLGRGEGRKLLDVGCGDGSFVDSMRRNGWDASGIDPDPKAVVSARSRFGIDVSCGVPGDLIGNGRQYAVITARHVIEHVVDPVAFLADCGKLLCDGGRVALMTPNAASHGHRMFGPYWRGLEVPRHLFVFTQSALHACARRAGLVQEKMFTTSANAGGMIGVSRAIAKHGRYDPRLRSRTERISEWASRPMAALRARVQLCIDSNSGEEIYAMLKPATVLDDAESRLP